MIEEPGLLTDAQMVFVWVTLWAVVVVLYWIFGRRQP
jgi:hypothetical protein